MSRKDLMMAIALASGLALVSGAALAAPGTGKPQGFAKSGNVHAAGGPENPGKGNPFNAY